MRRACLLLGAAFVLGACTLAPPKPAVLSAWPERMQALQAVEHWGLQGRAAGAVGTQGWQASLEWRQSGHSADVRLAGPLGAGAVAVKLSPQGIELDPPAKSDPDAFLSERLGFTPPFEQLRFWLLGVPSPAMPFELASNDQGRAAQITQAGWNIEYGEYMRAGADVLPKRIVLRRDGVRVRVAVDRWSPTP
jgi:outer membrane lipoprotein LolB